MLNCDMRKHLLPPPRAATGSIISLTHGPICKTWASNRLFLHGLCISLSPSPALFGLPPIRLLTDSGCSMLGRSRERGSWWPRMNLTAQQIPASTYLTITVKTSQQICVRLLYRFFTCNMQSHAYSKECTSFNTQEISIFSFFWNFSNGYVCFALFAQTFKENLRDFVEY